MGIFFKLLNFLGISGAIGATVVLSQTPAPNKFEEKSKNPATKKIKIPKPTEQPNKFKELGLSNPSTQQLQQETTT